MKSVLLSIRLYYFYLTYKGIKTKEIRKKFPLNYKGKIYEYVSKTNWKKDLMKIPAEEREFFKQFVGKVGLCFECDKVEKINPSNLDNFAKDSCLTIQELENYLWSNICCGYAVHITKLEIFDKPKEISEFNYWNVVKNNIYAYGEFPLKTRLTRAPQSYCFIEI